MFRFSRPSMRLIPAHAGITYGLFRADGFGWAHPRSRGEHTRNAFEPMSEMGSSPLTRGAPLHVQVWCDTTGLIPAHAGSTT